MRLRVITALAASPGLKNLGERYEDLTLYTRCIDAELDAQSNGSCRGLVTPNNGSMA